MDQLVLVARDGQRGNKSQRPARQRAYRAVNTALIDLYWQVAACLSRKIEAAEWGDGVVTQLAEHLARTQPGMRGFTLRNLFRMRSFDKAYRGYAIVTAVPSQLSAEAETAIGISDTSDLTIEPYTRADEKVLACCDNYRGRTISSFVIKVNARRNGSFTSKWPFVNAGAVASYFGL